MVFRYFYFKSIWWRLFQKCFVCTLVNIYVFTLTVTSVTSHLRLSIWPLYPSNANFISFTSHCYLLPFPSHIYIHLKFIIFPSHRYILSTSPLFSVHPIYFLFTTPLFSVYPLYFLSIIFIFQPIFPLISHHLPFIFLNTSLYFISISPVINLHLILYLNHLHILPLL